MNKTHDATFRYIQILSAELFKSELRRFSRTIDELFQSNRRLTLNHGDGLVFAGQIFKPSQAPTHGKLAYTTVEESLIPVIQALVADQQTVASDKKLMEQMFFRLLSSCNTHQDVRDALPDCLQDVLPPLQMHERTRPQAYTLRGDDRAMRQFEKILPRIEFYSAVRLIY